MILDKRTDTKMEASPFRMPDFTFMTFYTQKAACVFPEAGSVPALFLKGNSCFHVRHTNTQKYYKVPDFNEIPASEVDVQRQSRVPITLCKFEKLKIHMKSRISRVGRAGNDALDSEPVNWEGKSVGE